MTSWTGSGRPSTWSGFARTYWRFLSRVSLGLLRVLYTDSSREVVLITRPFVLLRFKAPEYELEAEGGMVTWPIDRGLLVAPNGRGRGYLRLGVRRLPAEDTASEATAVVTSEVVNFYPVIAGWGWFARVGRLLYNQTQLRIHVIVTNAFLRSLANLELEPSRVGALSPRRSPTISRSFARSWRAVIVRTVPERARIEIDSVVAPLRTDVVHAVQHLAVRDAGGGEEHVLA